MQLLIAINCSARKTAAPVPNLRARSLPRGATCDLAEEWRTRCSHADGYVAARRLYSGRGFSLAYGVGTSTGAQLRVVSAGMGLLHPETAIPAYSLTLSEGTHDCILGRASRNEAFTSQEWWQAIRSRVAGAKPFERLLAAYPRGLLLLALTRPYLNMLTDELAALRDAARERVRIIGHTQAQMLPEELRVCVMPYDARLNDVARDMRGTTFDFPSRALVHFAELVKLDKRIEDTKSHARRVRQSLAHWRAPELNARKHIDDNTLRREVRALKDGNFSRTAGLRHLRRELGFACEQGRFMASWDHT
jgi:hypothetical protein